MAEDEYVTVAILKKILSETLDTKLAKVMEIREENELLKKRILQLELENYTLNNFITRNSMDEMNRFSLQEYEEAVKTTSNEEKKRFPDTTDNDKNRFDTQTPSYVPYKTEKNARKKRKQLKDPNAPKRSLSAFFWFCHAERGEVKAKNPDYGVGEMAKELGRKWADAEPHVKQKYEQIAVKDKARYERELTQYRKISNGIPIDQVAPKESDGEEAEDDDEEEGE